ncbi:MAG: glycosyltransferase, partial [Pyrinomonadaceae bacterium]
THNRAAFLPRAVESARRAGTDLEIIVVDNASTDDTPQVCEKLKGVRYVRLGRNARAAGARNVGIRESRSAYIALLDDDDLRLPDSLDVQLSLLQSTPQAALVYGQALIGDAQDCLPTGDYYPDPCPTGDVFWQLLENNFIPVLSVVARKERLIEAGLFDESLTSTQDWDMWLRVTEKCEVIAVEEPVAIYRKWTLSSGQTSSDRALVYGNAALVQARGLALPRAMAASPRRREQVRRQFLNRMSDGLMYEAGAALAGKHLRAACADVGAALRLRPSRIAHPRALRSFFAGALRQVVRS